MNHPVAQIVALTCHGNAILCGHGTAPFFPNNSTCRFCERVSFVTLDKTWLGKTKELDTAQTPDQWFALLKSSGAWGIRLSRAPQGLSWLSDRMSAGLVDGGGTWTLEVLFPDQKSERWVAGWQVTNPQAPDQRIWRVTYRRGSRSRTRPLPPVDLSDLAAELHASLEATADFSARKSLDTFTKAFDEAMDTLSTKGQVRHGYHQDLAPHGFLRYDEAMLLDACQRAWVFGGMGSWNDLGFEGDDQKLYERLSDRLFRAVNEAIEAAATSTFKEGRTAPTRP